MSLTSLFFRGFVMKRLYKFKSFSKTLRCGLCKQLFSKAHNTLLDRIESTDRGEYDIYFTEFMCPDHKKDRFYLVSWCGKYLLTLDGYFDDNIGLGEVKFQLIKELEAHQRARHRFTTKLYYDDES